jgi:hypothetical protein
MAEQTHLQPSEVHEVLARHVLTDGMKLVLDLRHRPNLRRRAGRNRSQQAGQSGHVQHRIRRVRRDLCPRAR